MSKFTKKLLMVCALVVAIVATSLGAILTPNFGAVKAEENKLELDLSSFGRQNVSTGGPILASFDSVGVYTVTAGGTAEIKLPVSVKNAGAIVIEFKNQLIADLTFNVSLHAGEAVYALAQDDAYATAKLSNMAISALTAGENGAIKVAKPATCEAFDGYVILDFAGFEVPADVEIDAITVSVGIATAASYNVGSVYTLGAMPAETLSLEGATKVYTPAAETFTLGGTTDNFVATFMRKGDYSIQQAVAGDRFDPAYLKLPAEVMKDNIGDLSAYKALAFEVDFSEQTVDFQWACTLFINLNNYNASRMWLKKLIGIGENGTYFESIASMTTNTPWTIPAGFKGVLYMGLEEVDKGANVKEQHSLATLYPYIRFYNMTGKGNLTTGPIYGNISEAYFTNVIPSVEYKTVNVSVNDEVRGSYKLSAGPSVAIGTNVTLTTTVNPGYIVEYVKVGETNIEGENGIYNLGEITEDKEVYVHFGFDPNADRFTWTASGANATVTADKEEIPNGSTVTFTVKAAPGYEVTSVVINGEEVALTKNNVYTVAEVTADVTVSVSVSTVEKYATELGNNAGSEVYKPAELGTIYADFDSWFVSSAVGSQAEAAQLGSMPYIGADLGAVSVNDWSKSDVIVIRYQHYQTSPGKVNGVKFLLEDANGNMSRDNSTSVYLADEATGKAYGNSEAYYSGGMIFTPAHYSGYIVLPISCFNYSGPVNGLNIVGGLDFTNIAKVHAYTEYKWSTDVNARFAIGDIYIAKFNSETLMLSDAQQVWNPNEATVNTWAHGDINDGVTADDFIFASKMQGGQVYFYDYVNFANTTSALKINFVDNMLVGGFADLSAVKALQLYVNNKENAKDVNYSISLFAASGSEAEWKLNGLGKVIFHDINTLATTYCAANTTIIPAGFEGYVYIPLDNTVFSSSTGEVEFPVSIKDYMLVTFPTVEVIGLEHGAHIGFNAEFLTVHSSVEYEVTGEATEYTINYVLDGGVNGSNPATYKLTDTIEFAAATKEGFRFDGWYMTADFSGAKVESVANTCGNITLYAKWGASYTITYEISEGGTMYPAKETAEQGETITFAIFPDDGYVIAFVSVNGVSVALTEEDTFTVENVSENLTILVEFEREQVDSSSSANQGGDDVQSCASAVGTSGLGLLAVLGLAVIIRKKSQKA